MEDRIKQLLKNWEKRGIEGFYFPGRKEAVEQVMKAASPQVSIGFSGSQTLEELGVIPILEARGNKVYNPYQPGITREESMRLRMQASQADFYLASANAVAETGELVFFSAYGNRTSGVSSAKNVLLLCGINKLVSDVELALKRAREYATPLNCKRLNWKTPCFVDGVCHSDICFTPDYKRMCCQLLIIESEAIPGRLKVILIGEPLGF